MTTAHDTTGNYGALAAGLMMEQLDVAWDSLTPYSLTARAGYLADPDADALRAICAETGDDYDAAHAEVMGLIRNRVAIAG